MERLLHLMKKNKKWVVGLMSGTSLDGIDCALVEIEGNGLSTRARLLHFHKHPMDPQLRENILSACSLERSSVDQICRLNFDMGNVLGDAVLQLCKEYGISPGDIDLIGSHGQTIYHIPQHSTLQIGEPGVIAEKTGILTVADFRVRDVAAGGHGAPLVPYTEYLLYRNPEKSVALQNIGGIGNVTVIPKGCGLEEVFAFDTGPGNMIIDGVIWEMTQGEKTYDEDGKLAAAGKVDDQMLEELMRHPYIHQKPPKTTGRENFGKEFSRKVLKQYREKNVSDQDILATLTYFTAMSIAYNYRQWILPNLDLDQVIVGGGGSYNHTLMSMLRTELKGISVKTQEEAGGSSDAKEATAFAVLANECIHGNPGNVPRVTGARKPVILGKIIF